MKWTMNPKKQWPTILNGQSGDSQDLWWCSERVSNTFCRLSTGLWWWSPRPVSCSTSPRTPPSTLVIAWRTCWSTGTASTTSSTSRTTPRCRQSCCAARSWRAPRNWVRANPRTGSFFAGWTCRETRAGRCDLGTRRWDRGKAHFLKSYFLAGDPGGGALLRDPPQRESQWARLRCLVHSRCHARDQRVCRPGQIESFTPSSSSFQVLFSSFPPHFHLVFAPHMWFCRARLIYSARFTPWT